ncbi:hypothetical protein CXB51_034996 [Gossypium anomalum]|uniref:DUF4283 domain-containing protein n=1 Tax=Gossypium anomalum TaxID=47600 RepID=A0A8J6CK23_9ROSI|nr:hypothetical protein CXB51_034996 [Gossypium anomalum]
MEKELDGLNIDDGEEEEEAVLLPINPVLQKSAYEYCLVGCFLTSSVVHFTVMKTTMANLWHPPRGVQIMNLGGRQYLFKFFHELDVYRVVSGSPWTFNSYLLIIHRLKNDEDLKLVSLIYSAFWVQVHDLPLGFFSKAIAKQLDNFVGHSDKFCPTRLNLKGEIMEFGWSISLKVVIGRAISASNVWLREEGDDPINPQTFFLMETNLDGMRIGKVRRKCGFKNEIDVQAEVSRGGLMVILTRFCMLIRRLEEFQGKKGAWRTFAMCSRIFSYSMKVFRALGALGRKFEQTRERIEEGIESSNLKHGGFWRIRVKRLFVGYESLNQNGAENHRGHELDVNDNLYKGRDFCCCEKHGTNKGNS